jgi:hypothetical protein
MSRDLWRENAESIQTKRRPFIVIAEPNLLRKKHVLRGYNFLSISVTRMPMKVPMM